MHIVSSRIVIKEFLLSLRAENYPEQKEAICQVKKFLFRGGKSGATEKGENFFIKERRKETGPFSYTYF